MSKIDDSYCLVVLLHVLYDSYDIDPIFGHHNSVRKKKRKFSVDTKCLIFASMPTALESFGARFFV